MLGGGRGRMMGMKRGLRGMLRIMGIGIGIGRWWEELEEGEEKRNHTLIDSLGSMGRVVYRLLALVMVGRLHRRRVGLKGVGHEARVHRHRLLHPPPLQNTGMGME